MDYIATYKINDETHSDKLCPADFAFFFKYINIKKFTFVSLVPAEETEEEFFGKVRWCAEDIKNALEVNSIPATPENVGKLLDAVNTHHFTDYMISAGWDYIYQKINNVDFEKNTEE